MVEWCWTLASGLAFGECWCSGCVWVSLDFSGQLVGVTGERASKLSRLRVIFRGVRTSETGWWLAGSSTESGVAVPIVMSGGSLLAVGTTVAGGRSFGSNGDGGCELGGDGEEGSGDCGFRFSDFCGVLVLTADDGSPLVSGLSFSQTMDKDDADESTIGSVGKDSL